MNLPSHTRLVAGTRLLNPFTGTHHKYGGRFVHVKGWTEDGKVIVRMKMPYGPDLTVYDQTTKQLYYHDIYFHVEAESIGLKTPPKSAQQTLIHQE